MYPEKQALYVNSELTLELMKELKATKEIEALAAFGEEELNRFIHTLMPLTGRDLMFYALGKTAAAKMAEEAMLARRRGKGEHA